MWGVGPETEARLAKMASRPSVNWPRALLNPWSESSSQPLVEAVVHLVVALLIDLAALCPMA